MRLGSERKSLHALVAAAIAVLVGGAAGGASLPTWEVNVSNIAKALSKEDVRAAVLSLRVSGFVVLRGGMRAALGASASASASAVLAAARSAAEAEVAAVSAAAIELGLSERFWDDVDERIQYQEAASYSPGRLDLPDLMDAAPFDAAPWRNNPSLLRICGALFDDDCVQSRFGALLNYPGSRTHAWHRDGPNRLIVAAKTDQDYPAEAGWLQVQPQTHVGGARVDVNANSMPKPGEPPALKLVLRQGDVVVFQYSLKHGATPNPSTFERCLLYSVYGPADEGDTKTYNADFPRFFPHRSSKKRRRKRRGKQDL